MRERPEQLIAAIRQQLEADVTYADIERRERDIRARAKLELIRLVRNPCKRVLILFVLKQARFAIASRESMRFARTRLFGLVRRLFAVLGAHFAAQKLIVAATDIHYLTLEEIFSAVEGASVTRNLAGLVELRKADYVKFKTEIPAPRIATRGIALGCDLERAPVALAACESAVGTPCSAGVGLGVARVVHDPSKSLGTGAHVIVARSTDPGWVFLMTQARGLVVEKGSVLSHTAIIGRELGIPTVVGFENATRRIPDGSEISVDGSTGRVTWESGNSHSTAR